MCFAKSQDNSYFYSMVEIKREVGKYHDKVTHY